jgi:hypothetical protein
MTEKIRGRLNEMLGEDAVRTMFFRHAGWEARRRRLAGRRGYPSRP